ncbi:hypothetical protein K439DRAFT_1368458 [Ramaria rubella]|nr:hypothetical protein K439DRAFT_1368458 [Ramaria rubella]
MDNKRIHTAHSGCWWMQAQLKDYTINFDYQDVKTFFEVDTMPESVVNPQIMVSSLDDIMDDHIYNVVMSMEWAVFEDYREELVFNGFAVELLCLLNYNSKGQIFCMRKDLPLLMCGESKKVKPNLCIINTDQWGIILLIEEDKHLSNVKARAQLVAEVIACFTYNNGCRQHTELPELSHMVIPSVTLVGTSPNFFKILVTRDLEYAVCHGVAPKEKTIIPTHRPEVLRPGHFNEEGMYPLDNRQAILQCYEAFKKFL